MNREVNIGGSSRGKNIIFDTIGDMQSILMKGVFDSNWPAIGAAVWSALCTTATYIWCLYHIVFLDLPYDQLPHQQLDKWAIVHIYHLALTFKLWYHKHYRAASYQQDLKDNLRNVALPGTGIPLSVFCCHYWVALVFVALGVPLYCFLGAVHTELDIEIRAYLSSKTTGAPSTANQPATTGARMAKSKLEEVTLRVMATYSEYLLHPTDWFSLWRLNCTVVALHSHVSQSRDYEMENKWSFLVDGRRLGVPVSPFMETVDTLVCKHRNIEGGMGVHFFHNAAHGGDWILQPKLHNAAWLTRMLPSEPPLSTMRIVTCSSCALYSQGSTPAHERTPGDSPVRTEPSVDSSGAGSESGSLDGFDMVSSVGEGAAGATAANRDVTKSQSSDAAASSDGSTLDGSARDHIKAMSCVLRLGRQGAITDHQSVLFDVDIGASKHCLRGVTRIGSGESKEGAAAGARPQLGEVKDGYTNAHWYQLGLLQFNMLCNVARQGISSPHLSWLWTGAVEETQQCGLSEHMDVPGQRVSGTLVPNIEQALEIVTDAHFKMMKDVPLAGWDVAFTTEGVFLLEANLSCNFFKGTFDRAAYVDLVDAYWRDLDRKL